jgi:hypothetical protein
MIEVRINIIGAVQGQSLGRLRGTEPARPTSN